MTSIFLGIDPGMTGAIAIIDPVLSKGVGFYDTPVVNIGKKGQVKHEYDTQEMASVLREFAECRPAYVFIERQQAMPDQGVSSTFATGRGYGLWLGILTALGIPYEVIAPVTWKKKLMADMSKEKGASIIVAKRLFPQVADDLKLKKHHGRADALLLAEFGRRRMLGAA